MVPIIHSSVFGGPKKDLVARMLMLIVPVSYTHLDVYKRQVQCFITHCVYALNIENNYVKFLQAFSQSIQMITDIRKV